MRTIPTDSTDAREQLEAEAEQVRRDAVAAARREQDERDAEHAHAAACAGGWLGHDEHGRPLPCLRCRPHLRVLHCTTCSSSRTRCRELEARGHGCCCDRCDHSHQIAGHSLGATGGGPS